MAVIVRLAVLFCRIIPLSGGLRSIMSNETSEFSVEDGKLVREDTEEANFEENLTFEGDDGE